MQVSQKNSFRMGGGVSKDIITNYPLIIFTMVSPLAPPANYQESKSPPIVGMFFARSLHSTSPVSSCTAIPTSLRVTYSGNFFLTICPRFPSSIRNSAYFGLYVSIPTYVYSANSPNPSRCAPRQLLIFLLTSDFFLRASLNPKMPSRPD